MRATSRAVAEQPQINARFDDRANMLRQYDAVHLGIATQTDAGLTVPVVKNAEILSIWQSAAEVGRLSESARSGTATMEQLSGSTITITSLGPLGAIATTPIINHPEVAIVGVNKMMMRPMWDGAEFQPRKMMNLSCSFDHRVIDGWDAAVFVQRLKSLLEDPVMMIMGE
jgi:2-oxoisovalerate dehydrogenase E2 component (dihydrolipoyl transacylase)